MLQSISSASDNSGAITGGVVAIVLIIAVTIAVVAKTIATTVMKSRNVEVTWKQRQGHRSYSVFMQ